MLGLVEKGEGSHLISMMSSIESGEESFCVTRLSSRMEREEGGEELIKILNKMKMWEVKSKMKGPLGKSIM